MKINCKYPSIIRNPEFNKSIINGYRYIYNNGNLIYTIKHSDISKVMNNEYLRISAISIARGYIKNDNTSVDLPTHISYKDIKNYKRDDYHRNYSITYDDIDNIIITNENGEYLPVFIIVPCSHCELCSKLKRNKLVTRAKLESTKYINPPIFVTLTFNNNNYPDDTSLENQTTIIQKFHKRLRKYLSTSNLNCFEIDDSSYKYVAVSEFGKLHNRLHYHMLIYGLSSEMYETINCDSSLYGINNILKITEFIKRSWPFGFIKVEVASDKTGKYVSKYVGKGFSKETKHWKSVNFGKDAIVNNLDDIRKNPQKNSFQLLVDNSIEDIPMYKFIKDIVYPSPSRMLNIEFRRKLEQTLYLIENEHNSNYINIELEHYKSVFYKKYSEFLIIMGYDLDKKYYNLLYNSSLPNLIKELKKSLEFLSTYSYDIDYVTYVTDLRNQHLLMTNVNEYDVEFNSYVENLRINTYRENERDWQ